MEAVSIILAMLVAVLLSGVLVRVLPISLPLSLVQIALGALIAAVSGGGVKLNPDMFFLLFLPPLLFLDGWRIPKDGLIRDKLGVVQLAFGLVIMTVLGLGFLIHWMIPAMPLTVAFALAAIVSPTDPVAVSAIARRTTMPKRLLLVLESEALFNDASGLVAFRFAVAATVTGSFSLTSAFGDFLWMAFAGLAIGAAVTWTINVIRNWFVQRYSEEPGSEILLSLLAPFAAYFLAEHAQASGILAAVAAGVTMSYSELSGRALAATRVRREVVWDVVQFTLTGIMFVLLGEQLPSILKGAVAVVAEAGHHDVWWLAVYPVVICIALTVIRFFCVFVTLKAGRIFRGKKQPQAAPVSMRLMLVLSLAGVRGTITLAGVMTLPLVLQDGSVFPARDLAIFLAAMVIILSLIIASVGLPALLRDYSALPETRYRAQEALAIQAAREAAIKSIGRTLDKLILSDTGQNTSLYTEVAGHILDELRTSDDDMPEEERRKAFNVRWAIEREMRLDAVKASREAVFQLARERRISDALAREQVMKLDLHEVRLS